VFGLETVNPEFSDVLQGLTCLLK